MNQVVSICPSTLGWDDLSPPIAGFGPSGLVTAPVIDRSSGIEGDYEGLLAGAVNARMECNGDSLRCTFNRQGAPPLHGKDAAGPIESLGLSRGWGESGIGCFLSPGRYKPDIVLGPSGRRKLVP